MKIQDLSKELDAQSLSAVRGGDNGNSLTNLIGQVSAISVPVEVGYGAGSAGNTFVHVDGSQNAGISNQQTSGDKFAAFLGDLKGL
jgi:hypothetical protein